MVWLTVITLLCLTSAINGKSVYEDFQMRSGQLKKNETWSGKNLLTADVQVPKGITLTLAPDTWIVYNNVDTQNIGKNPDRVELIVEGVMTQSPTNPAKILAISDQIVQDHFAQYNNGIMINQDTLSTTPIQEKIRSHKRKYIISWVLTYCILLVFL